MKNSESGKIGLWFAGVLGVVIVIFLLLSMRVVDTSETCAWVRLGKVVGEAETGFQFTNPLNKKVCYPRQAVLFQTAGDVNGDGEVDSEADYKDFPVEIKTADGQTAMLEFNLLFHVEPGCAVIIRQEVASNKDDLVIRVINNFSRSLPRDLAPKYTATQLYGLDRVLLENDIKTELIKKFEKNCVVLDEFIMRDIGFTPAYEDTIDKQQIAKENIETQRFVADQAVEDARASVTKAKGEADAQIEKARGQAKTTELMAIAEADAMKIKGQALKDFPEMIQLKFFDALSTSQWSLVPWDSVGGYMPLPTQNK